MAFSTNQNRHLYVVKAFNETVNETSLAGTIGKVKVVGLGKDKELVFSYAGPGGTMTSDRIALKNLDYVKSFAASELVEPLKVVKVSLSEDVNDGKVVVGQDYVLRITFRQWIGPDERYTYIKDGAVRATSAMVDAPLKFYQAMVESLNLAFSREIGATKTSNPYLKFEAAADGITVTEKEQDWVLGVSKQERVLFDVQPTTIFVNSVDEVWGKTEDKTPKKDAVVAGTTGIGNGKKIADLEYFCMGERGDQYRNVGWPNVVPTTYLVDPNKQYHVLEIHHAFTDEGVNSYRSEKDITIVADDATELNKFIASINSAASDLEVATIATA